VPVLEDLHQPEVAHVEVEVVVVPGVPGPEQHAEDIVPREQAQHQGAQEARVDRGVPRPLAPVSEDAHLEGVLEHRIEAVGERRPLGQVPEVEPATSTALPSACSLSHPGCSRMRRHP
jgi:hypothetical protein